MSSRDTSSVHMTRLACFPSRKINAFSAMTNENCQMMNGKSSLPSRIIQCMTREPHIAGRMRFKPWLQFLLCVLFLSLLIGFRGTWFSRALDFVFVCFSLAFLVFLSFLIVRARWKRRESPNNRRVQSSEDKSDEVLRRVRRWWTDDQKPG